MHDLLVLGSGIAGLTTALRARRHGFSVLVLTKGRLDQSATQHAQGGVAAALEPPDSPDLHFHDTLLAGAGICDEAAVRVLVGEGPARVHDLAALGTRFDETDDAWHRTREGGHTIARVIHAGGDATGAEIERALVDNVSATGIDVREGVFFADLLVEDGRCVGVAALDAHGERVEVRGVDTVLATGGVGQCFAVTTNPMLSTGDGVAAALRAGVACADLEFVQFHPTALAADVMPRPLLSEALRGEGARLRDVHGRAIMPERHPQGDLAPRDVVSRVVHETMRRDGTEHVWLDATSIAGFAQRFPNINARCLAAGLDPARDYLPVAPAAHYLSGGIVADLDGATTLPRLWACGEVACSGVHGANRLASNSLLDGLVFGHRVVEAIVGAKHEADETGAMRGVRALTREPSPVTPGEPPVSAGTAGDAADVRASVQRTMSAECGVVRDADGLDLAEKTLAELADLADDDRDVATLEARNIVCVARATVASARAREESRGTHTRRDHPETDPRLAGRFVVSSSGAPSFVPLVVTEAPA